MLCCRGPKPLKVLIEHGEDKDSKSLAQQLGGEIERVFKDEVIVALKTIEEDAVYYTVIELKKKVKNAADIQVALMSIGALVASMFPGETAGHSNEAYLQDVSTKGIEREPIQKELSREEEPAADVPSVAMPPDSQKEDCQPRCSVQEASTVEDHASAVNHQDGGNPAPFLIQGPATTEEHSIQIDLNQRNRELEGKKQGEVKGTSDDRVEGELRLCVPQITNNWQSTERVLTVYLRPHQSRMCLSEMREKPPFNKEWVLYA
ncbi:hypothetical protein Ciccas_010824 [Cichlidogyrus casuarinus]|uniref:Uncharacterized protein n=1 Tax=Cichlidogyrus casuarinus TaxID=1844966 RepID=A0ABD2PU71_9PLAT